MRIAHVALNFGSGHKRRHRIDHDDVHGIRTHQRFADFERLLAGIGLAHQEVFETDAEVARVSGVDGVFDIDVGGSPAGLLGFGHDVLRKCALAGGLRPENLRHTTARDPAYAEGDVERERPGRNDFDRSGAGLAELDDGAPAELFLDLGERQIERACAVTVCHASPVSRSYGTG